MVEIFAPTAPFDKHLFAQFCQEYHFSFPEEYVRFLEEHHDGTFSSNVVSGAEDCAIRYFFGTGKEDYANLAWNYRCFRTRIPAHCVPVAELECGNLLCLSLDAPTYGKIYLWDHETMDCDDGEVCSLSVKDLVFVADSLPDLLSKVVEDSLPEPAPRRKGFFGRLFGK